MYSLCGIRYCNMVKCSNYKPINPLHKNKLLQVCRKCVGNVNMEWPIVNNSNYRQNRFLVNSQTRIAQTVFSHKKTITDLVSTGLSLNNITSSVLHHFCTKTQYHKKIRSAKWSTLRKLHTENESKPNTNRAYETKSSYLARTGQLWIKENTDNGMQWRMTTLRVYTSADVNKWKGRSSLEWI